MSGEAYNITCNGTGFTGPDLIKAHLPASLANQLDKGADLVSIGAASCEGGVETEKVRSQQRASNIAQWVSSQPDFKGNVWVINLGRFRIPCRDSRRGDTTAQRPVILATIAHQDDARAVCELLKRGLMSGANKTGSRIPNPGNQPANSRMSGLKTRTMVRSGHIRVRPRRTSVIPRPRYG